MPAWISAPNRRRAGLRATAGTATGLADDAELDELKDANLGPLAAIGEQKATQFFAQLASRFDEKAGSDYEAIFAAWGGDVRERSIDLATGQLRPREMTPARRRSPGPAGDVTTGD